jgi:hypothetical protein
MTDYKAYRFFRKHGGSIVGREVESAASYAHDEVAARAAGIEFRWEPDQDAWGAVDMLGDHEHWCNDARREAAGYTEAAPLRLRGKRPIPVSGERDYGRAANCHSHEVEVCDAYDASGEFLTSLGGVIDPTDTDRRVVEAEVAGMALEIVRERDSHALDLVTV